jgi:hypothetical protein
MRCSGFGVQGTALKEGLQSFNPERETVNLEPLGFRFQRRLWPQTTTLIEEEIFEFR